MPTAPLAPQQREFLLSELKTGFEDLSRAVSVILSAPEIHGLMSESVENVFVTYVGDAARALDNAARVVGACIKDPEMKSLFSASNSAAGLPLSPSRPSVQTQS